MRLMCKSNNHINYVTTCLSVVILILYTNTKQPPHRRDNLSHFSLSSIGILLTSVR